MSQAQPTNRKIVVRKKANYMNLLYFVSAIVKYEPDGKPCLLAIGTSYPTEPAAMEAIDNIKKEFITLSAWVDSFDENNNKSTVFHECYLDPFGHIQNYSKL